MGEAIAGNQTGAPERVEAAPSRPPSSSASTRFAVTAVVLGLGLFGLFRVPWVQARVLIPYAEAQQQVAGAVTGQTKLPVIVSFACTGADVIALCVASVLAFPVPWRKRVQGALVGLLLITVVNTVRIGSLSLVAERKELFDTLHLVVWPAILIVLVSLYVFFWMRWARGARSASETSTATERSAALRFALCLVPLTLLFVLFSARSLDAPWILEATRWTASVAAAAMGLLGVASRVTGNTLSTAHGGFVVTPTCIATPLVPVYLAAALALPANWLRRAGWLLLGPIVFFALGVARLLVLALPASVVPSYSDAIHSFNSLLFAAILIALAAMARGGSGLVVARRAALALTLGAAVAIVAAFTWTRALGALAPALLGWIGHSGHTWADTQSATTFLPAFQLGLFAALAWAFVPAERRSARRLVAATALLAVSQLAFYLLLAELWSHRGFEPHVRDQRAWMVLAPALLVWWLDGRGLRSFLPRHRPADGSSGAAALVERA